MLAVGLANYLWPSLIMLFSLPILHKRGRAAFLLPGIALALGGTWLAVASAPFRVAGGGEALGELFSPDGSLLPVALAALAALLWGLYSNLTRRWGGETGSAVPLFLLASGLACLPLRFLAGESAPLTQTVLPGLLYMALFPAWLAYSLWDRAMQRGDLVLVTAFSYFTPLLSTLASLLVLQVALTPQLGLGALLLVAAVLNIIYVFNSFPIVWTLNDRNPGMAHDTMITYMYKIAFKSALRDVGLAAALGVVNVGLILIAVLAYLKVSRWREEPV